VFVSWRKARPHTRQTISASRTACRGSRRSSASSSRIGPAASIQLSRLVQAYVAEPGPSLEEKATRVGVRRNELLRAARGTISRTTRLRLLVFFAAAGARPGRDPSTPAGERAHCQRKRGFT